MVDIRNFKKEDFEVIKKIYQQGIDSGLATFQTQAKNWQEWDNSVLPICRLVAVDDSNVLGWAALSSISDRCVYGGVSEVTVYVATEAQGRGIGYKLLSALIKDSEKNNMWTLQAGIFPENQASINLHKKCGFRIVGTREKLGQINGVWHDVVLLERRSKVVGT